jgi:hypothetical protein
MPPKKSNTANDSESQNGPNSEKPAVSDEEVRQESGKAANASLSAQKKAKDLKAAAEAAGDPDERQKLMEESIDAQTEAESFGKTAKYLRSGAFQGMAVGTGLGVAPGASLGAITGTLVGGVSSTIFGGLGAGLGGATGALHGPFWNVGKVAGKGIKKVTGNLPGWVASDEQKATLEKMVSQANEEEMPDESELEKFKSEGGGGEMDEGWMESAKGMMPKKEDMQQAAESGAQTAGGESGKDDSKPTEDQTSSGESKQKSENQGRKKPRKLNVKPSDEAETPKANDGKEEQVGTDKALEQPNGNRDANERTKQLDEREAELDRRQSELDEREKTLSQRERKLESKSNGNTTNSEEAPKPKGKPRKLESRSTGSS